MKMNSLLDAAHRSGRSTAPRRPGSRWSSTCAGSAPCARACAGVSENIEVVSVVGRFLEHSRIYSFERHGEPESVYIGSADLMPRNLYNRVELVIPIDDDKVRAELVDVLDRSLADNTNSWELGADGDWTRRAPGRRAAQRPARADRAPRRARGLERRGRDAVAADLASAPPPMLERHDAHGLLARARPARPSRAPPLERRRAAPTWSSSAAATPGCGPPGT